MLRSSENYRLVGGLLMIGLGLVWVGEVWVCVAHVASSNNQRA